MLMVGIPVLGLLSILEAGRGVAAPLSIGGEWNLEFDPGAAQCPNSLKQPALSISQSGTEALITVNDGRATTLQASIQGTTVSAGPLTANILGKLGHRTLEGHMSLAGCTPVAFHAVRQPPKKGSE